MDVPLITRQHDLEDFCQRLGGVRLLALDTEFVSEHSFRPQLCLIQVAADEEIVLIDPLAVDDVTPFWQVVADGGQETVVHGGREEFLFCWRATGRPPARLVDLQIAAGLVGMGYPIGYDSLTSRLVGRQSGGGETRSDWRRRPLDRQQLQYAVDDVRYVGQMYGRLRERLEQLGRTDWLRQEMELWQEELTAAEQRERWRRVKGGTNLPRRGLAVLRELWRWRRDEAERRDVPMQRVLKDHMMVELARRRSGEPDRILALRGFERGDLRRQVPELARAIGRALALPEDELPRRPAAAREPAQFQVLAQFLSLGLAAVCQAAQLTPNLVATSADLKAFIARRLDGEADPEPKKPGRLEQGWRAEAVGQPLDDLLAGRVALRVGDPRQAEPIVFER